MIRKFFAALGCAVLGAAVMLLALPLLPKQLLPHGRAETLAATEAETAPAEPADEPFDEAVTLRVLVDGAVREQTLHDYLVCVLLAEVPSGFAAEALKAQACAARTFALRQAGAGKHAEADVCASAACCQGWCAPEQWPEHAAVETAVTETDGLAVVYDGQLIDATYFSCSGGRTEAAVAVWGGGAGRRVIHGYGAAPPARPALDGHRVFSAGGRRDGHDARLRPPRRPEPVRRGGHGAGGQAL